MIGGTAKLVADKASSVVRLELALAAAELKRKLRALGLGIVLVAAAAIFVVFGIVLGLATIVAALATVFATWLAFLIVTGGLFVLAGVLAVLGIGRIKKGTPPVPEQAIAEAKLTAEALRNGKH
jgi:Putative Actinobacterial Holin-X, holin superfamily III